MGIVQLPGFVVESVESRPCGKGEVYDIRCVTMGATLVFGTFSAVVAKRCEVGKEHILSVRTVAGKFNRPEVRLVDVAVCK